jgi:hypothetical protein
MVANGTNGSNGHAPDLQGIHDFLIDIATKAGKMIMSAHPLVNGVGSKKNSKLLPLPKVQRGIQTGYEISNGG